MHECLSSQMSSPPCLNYETGFVLYECERGAGQQIVKDPELLRMCVQYTCEMSLFPFVCRSQVAIVVEPPSSMDSAIDAEDSDEEPSVKFLQRPKRKRNSDSMDSGDMSDTESQPSSLHLAEMDEVPMMQSSQAFNQFSVVSCVADDAELPLQRNLHTIIIDCAPITFIDSVGSEVMEQVSMCMIIGCSLVPTALCGYGVCVSASFTSLVDVRVVHHKMMWCLCVLSMQIISEYDKIGIQVLLARTGSMFFTSACTGTHAHACTHSHWLST